MENKMKKLMLLAALGAAAIFTACGDDSSSAGGSDPKCEVKTGENSATMVQTVPGYGTNETTWKLEGDKILITYSDFPDNNTEEDAGELTADDLKKMAEAGCENFNKMSAE